MSSLPAAVRALPRTQAARARKRSKPGAFLPRDVVRVFQVALLHALWTDARKTASSEPTANHLTYTPNKRAAAISYVVGMAIAICVYTQDSLAAH
jgi:hypothetical protein